MRRVALPSKFQIFTAEAQKNINAGLKIYNRLSLGRIAKNFDNIVRLQKSEKVMFRHDFSGKYITQILGCADLGGVPLESYIGNEFVVSFNENNSDTCTLKGNETISVIARETSKAPVRKIKSTSAQTTYAIALLRKSRNGNNRYLTKDGSFDTGYYSRKEFKTMKSADMYVAKIVESGSHAINRLKIVSAEI